MTPGVLAKRLGVRRTRTERIASEQTGMTIDTALRLAKFLGTSAEIWKNLQTTNDLKIEAKALKAQSGACDIRN